MHDIDLFGIEDMIFLHEWNRLSYKCLFQTRLAYLAAMMIVSQPGMLESSNCLLDLLDVSANFFEACDVQTTKTFPEEKDACTKGWRYDVLWVVIAASLFEGVDSSQWNFSCNHHWSGTKLCITRDHHQLQASVFLDTTKRLHCGLHAPTGACQMCRMRATNYIRSIKTKYELCCRHFFKMLSETMPLQCSNAFIRLTQLHCQPVSTFFMASVTRSSNGELERMSFGEARGGAQGKQSELQLWKLAK